MGWTQTPADMAQVVASRWWLVTLLFEMVGFDRLLHSCTVGSQFLHFHLVMSATPLKGFRCGRLGAWVVAPSCHAKAGCCGPIEACVYR